MIFNNQENRQSFIFSALLKLYKFGNIQGFIESVRKHIDEEVPVVSMNFESRRKKSSYLEVAREIQRKKKTFSIRLVMPSEQDLGEMSPLR